MAITKRIVCFANSRKLGARCIAGREVDGDRVAGWVRPVTKREHGKVELLDCRCDDGTHPNILDIIDVPLIEPTPDGYQQENWLIAPKEPWRKVGRIEQKQLAAFAEPAGSLWIDGRSTSHGINDEIPLELAANLESSLRLIHVDELTLSVFSTDGRFGPPRRRVFGRFNLGGVAYRLSVTDPVYERRYRQKRDGDYAIGECFLTISLSWNS